MCQLHFLFVKLFLFFFVPILLFLFASILIFDTFFCNFNKLDGASAPAIPDPSMLIGLLSAIPDLVTFLRVHWEHGMICCAQLLRIHTRFNWYFFKRNTRLWLVTFDSVTDYFRLFSCDLIHFYFSILVGFLAVIFTFIHFNILKKSLFFLQAIRVHRAPASLWP